MKSFLASILGRTPNTVDCLRQKNRRWGILFVVVLYSLSVAPALAAMDFEPMGVFRLSTGIDGWYDSFIQPENDIFYTGALYGECQCEADIHDIQTAYRIESPEYCPFDIVLEKTKYCPNDEGNGFADEFNIVCKPNGKPKYGNRYSFTIKMYAQCGENIGWGELTIDLDVGLTPNQDGRYEYGNNTYKIYEGKYTYDEANALCEEMGGHLATITSEQEQIFINYLNTNDKCLWIGGYRGSKNNWSWITGESMSYTNWIKNEPNNGYDEVVGRFESDGEDVMCLYPIKWNDANRDNKMGFICEWGTGINDTPVPMPDGSENGDIFQDGSVLDTLLPVTVPTIILPSGEYIPADITVKFNEQQTDKKQSIKYDVRLVDGKGNDVELPDECLLIFPYPDGLDMNSSRQYRIMIHHYGKEGTEVFSTEDGTIELLPQGLGIQISSLSPFVIEWEEKHEDTMPQTGDNSHIALWLTLLTLAGIATLTLKRKTA